MECGCNPGIEFTSPGTATFTETSIVFCPMHAAAGDTAAERDGLRGELEELHRRTSEEKADMLAALDDCQKHITALTRLGPGDINIDAARASASAARDLCTTARGGAPRPDVASTPAEVADEEHQRFHHYAEVDWRDCPQAPCPERARAVIRAARGGAAVGLLHISEEERADAEMRTEGARDTLPRGGGA